MSLPFTAEQFFEVMRHYNEGVWPAQVALYGIAIAVLWLLAVHRSRAVSAGLALLWAWMALAYHVAYFSAINPLARGFGGAFLAAALLFAWEGVVRGRLQFQTAWNARAAAGTALLGYSLIAYPLLAMALGHRYPAMPTFGLPCPTTIFTLGMLAFLRPPIRRRVLLVPVLWTVVGAQAAWLFGVLEDLLLLLAGAAGLWLAFPPRTKASFA